MNFLIGGRKSRVKAFSYRTEQFYTDLQTQSKFGFVGGKILHL